MKSYLLGAVCAFTLAVLATTAHASLVVPAGLNPGDPYHVIFASSTVRDGDSSSDIADYDLHVQDAAQAAGTGIGREHGVEWLAAASTGTATINAHLSPLFSSTSDVPIYNMIGTLVSPSLDAMTLSGTAEPIWYDEKGALRVLTAVWTGAGCIQAFDPGSCLGAAEPMRGRADLAGIRSIYDMTGFGWTEHSVYAMSEELIVVPAVPLPPAVLLFGSGLLGLFGVAKRHAARA